MVRFYSVDNFTLLTNTRINLALLTNTIPYIIVVSMISTNIAGYTKKITVSVSIAYIKLYLFRKPLTLFRL